MASQSDDFLQQTREFSNQRAATHFIMRLRGLFGHKAKCFMRSQHDRTFVKFKVPATKPLPNSGKVVGDGEVWNQVLKTYLCQVSIKEGKRKPPTLLGVELMASSPELAAKRAQYTLWSRYRYLPLTSITVTDTKEIVDV